MECKDALPLIQPYLAKQLPLHEEEQFLRHVENCPSCREELEIYYTVNAAIDSMDNRRSDSLNLAGNFDRSLNEALHELQVRAVVRRIRDILIAIAFAAIILSSVLLSSILF